MSTTSRSLNMAKPILDIVTKPYIIPIYQRNYNWGFDEITQLLQDIYESYHKDKTQDYFLGSLIVFKRQSASIYEVIDGQQRLTTLSLYFLAIFEYLTEKSTEIFHKGPTEKILC